jgi:polyhydroxyalkanoate synthesis regulator phasin
MAAPMNDKNKRNRPPKQLRGKKLDERIEIVIKELAEKSEAEGRKYVFNASQVARSVPTTRRTIDRRSSLVDEILDELNSRRRMVTGSATIEQLRDQLARLKAQISERDLQINALRSHHIDIYERFHDHSLQAELLISPILEQEANEAGYCFFCGSESDSFVRKSNVVPFNHKHKD